MPRYGFSAPLNVSMILLKPTYTESFGVPVKSYPAIEDGEPFNGNFRTFGGTDRDVNGLYSIEDTAVIETWYRPDIQPDCRIVTLYNSAVYEVLGTPENIEVRNQYLRIKVRRLKGGA